MAVRKEMEGIGSFWFHAPFAELSPASIDPKVRGVTILRYRQAMEMAASLGISRLVIHSGFIPLVYFPEWFVEQSVVFWREFLEETPEGITIALENVMEPGPEMLVEIVRQVQDRRLGLWPGCGTCQQPGLQDAGGGLGCAHGPLFAPCASAQ